MDGDLRTKQQVLGTRFISRVVTQVDTLDQYVDELEQGTESHLPDLMQLTHQIAGTAATFGFERISCQAARMQSELEKISAHQSSASARKLRNLLLELNRAVKDAAAHR